MDKSSRLPPLGAPSSRPSPASEPPYAPLTFFDSRPPRSQPPSQPQQLPLARPDPPLPSRPSPSTPPTPFPLVSNPASRSSHRSTPIPVSSEAAVSKPKKLHREVEQRRRMRMAEQIAELRQCVSDPNSGKTDKVSILQDAVAFVKAAKRTIHSLQFKLQAAESECSRLTAMLTELQPSLLHQQPHHNPNPPPPHPHLHHAPPASPAVMSTTAHAAKPHAHMLPSNTFLRSPAFNFESVVPHSSLREAAAASTATRAFTPASEVPRAPIIRHASSWNSFSSSAQPFPHAAAGASPPSSSHFSHAMHRTQSHPSHSLPHLRGAHHQQHHQSTLGLHFPGSSSSPGISIPRSEATPQLEQHAQVQHRSHLEPAPLSHLHPRSSVSEAAKSSQATVLVHSGDQARMSPQKGQNPVQ